MHGIRRLNVNIDVSVSETLISNDMKPEIKSENTIVYNQLTNKEQVNSIENHAIKDGVERIKADKSEFQGNIILF